MTIPDLARFAYNFLLKHLSKPTSSGVSVGIAVPLGSGYSRHDDEKAVRLRVVARMRNLLGIPYLLGAEDADLKIETRPAAIDCSEAIELAYAQEAYFTRKMPDGARYQEAFCKGIGDPLPADLGFLHYISPRTGKQVWHVGMFTERETVIHASASRGEVVEDRVAVFTSHKGFLGWGRHPEFLQS